MRPFQTTVNCDQTNSRLYCVRRLFQATQFDRTVCVCALEDGLIRGHLGLGTSTWVAYNQDKKSDKINSLFTIVFVYYCIVFIILRKLSNVEKRGEAFLCCPKQPANLKTFDAIKWSNWFLINKWMKKQNDFFHSLMQYLYFTLNLRKLSRLYFDFE